MKVIDAELWKRYTIQHTSTVQFSFSSTIMSTF